MGLVLGLRIVVELGKLALFQGSSTLHLEKKRGSSKERRRVGVGLE